MTPAIFTFQRGEPVTGIGIEVTSGDPTGYTARALLKPTQDFNVPAHSAESAATFDVDFSAASGDDPAQWLLTLSAEDADALDRGRYVTDVQILLDGEPVMVTDPVFLELVESVSG